MSASGPKTPRRRSAIEIQAHKQIPEVEPIVMVTAYDFTMARLVDELVDIILVGDSVGMVVAGEASTLPVTMDQMAYHTRIVSRGTKVAHLVADMPFMSYQTSTEDGVRNAGRLVVEGADAVKIEGGVGIAATVARIVQSGIPVMGHVGLTPQSVRAFGGFRVQGRTERAQRLIIDDALALEQAGAYSLVVEGIPADLAERISEKLSIPTIGIGAGRGCDGQVLVLNDLLGLDPDFRPRFVRAYADLAAEVKKAVSAYAQDVRGGGFPGPENAF